MITKHSSPVDLKPVNKFVKGPYPYKYTAIMNSGQRVNFGRLPYQHYFDRIGKYSYLNHKDEKRRALYRIRHGAINRKGMRAIDKKYSPAWFSYHLLW